MLNIIALILCGYFGIAALRSLIVAIRCDDYDDSEIVSWAKQHPYHYIFKGWAKKYDKEAAPWAIIGIVFALTSWIAPFSILLQGNLANLALWPFCIGGMGLYLSVAIGYWLYGKGTFAKWEKQIKEQWQKAKNWWQSRIPAEIQEVKILQTKLAKIIKDRKKSSLKFLLSKVDAFVEKEMPRLLKLRAELQEDVANAKKIIKEEKDNGICEGEEKLMHESEEDLKALQMRLEKTKKKIEFGLAFLHHMIIRVELITTTDSLEESRDEIEEIQQELENMIKAHEEVGNIFKEIEKLPLKDSSQEKTEDFQREKLLTA